MRYDNVFGTSLREDMIRRLLSVQTAVILMALSAWAQDSHYWTYQYGTRSNLLGGSVVGSVLDLSGTFYNPGGLSLIDEPETLLAAKIFEYYAITLEDFAGSEARFDSPKFGPSPGLVAGALKFRGLKKSWFGYSVLSRQSVLLRLRGASIGLRDVLPSVPGPEETAADFRVYEHLRETWFGITWAYKIKESLGFGITQYVTYRIHRADVQSTAQALCQSGEIALATGSRQYRYNNSRILWKVGLAFDTPGITMGLTLTTPSLRFFGRGTSRLNATIDGQNLINGGEPDNFFAFNAQDMLRADMRTPLSLGMGATVKLVDVQLYGSAEWFAKVKTYAVMQGEDFVIQSTDQTHANEITHELRSVLNYGLGMEFGPSEKLRFYSSFTTDFSARSPETATNLSITDWNIYHIVGGTTFSIKRSSFTLGLGYAFGRRTSEYHPGFFTETGEELLGLDHFSIGSFTYRNFKLIAGFSF
jgi:hypothetical protein